MEQDERPKFERGDLVRIAHNPGLIGVYQGIGTWGPYEYAIVDWLFMPQEDFITWEKPILTHDWNPLRRIDEHLSEL